MFTHNLIEQMVSNPDNRALVTTDATATYARHLAVYEQDVTVDSTLGVGTIYLPDVGAAQGLLYCVTATVGNTHTVTVKEKATGNSLDWGADASLNAALDRGLWFSDGKRWWVLSDQFT